MKNLTFISLIAFALLSCTTQENKAPIVTTVETPVGANASLPHLITGENDQLYLSWIEKGDSGLVKFYYSAMKDDTWSTPELIASGNDWFVNWADYPMIAVDKDGNMVAHYLAKSSAGTYSYDVTIRYKKPNGQWQGPIIPHKDGTPTEHGFSTLLSQNDGTFLITWLDGRNTGGGEHEGHDMGAGGAMTIRTAVLDMQGNLSNETELDGRVCDCCQTTGAMTSAGPIIAYRDRTEDEIRDMSIVRMVNNQWTDPVDVSNDNWTIKGCPVNGPRLDAIEETVGMIWFSAANEKPKVSVRFSTNNGENFDEAIEVTNETVGRVDIAMIDKTSAMISWLAISDTSSAIMCRRIGTDRTQGESIKIATTSSARASGFPQLAYWKNRSYMAWTHLENGTSSIKLAILQD